MAQPQTETLGRWSNLQPFNQRRNKVELRGDSLTIPSLVAVSKCNAVASLDNLPRHIRAQIDESVKFLMESLANGHSVYGVTTGFGGSANTNTSSTNALQVALLQMQLCAVLPVSDNGTSSSYQGTTSDWNAIAKLSMPEEWVRAAMVVRCNSVLRGHSAVRLEVIQAIVNLLEHNLVPLVPLRGSISASGDLCPLSYIAGVLEGNPDVKVWAGPKNARTLIPSNEALKQAGMGSVQFGPKEILGLINGTAFSAGVATLAQHQADILAILAQILTAMGVEAMLGALDSFDPFIAAIRPHRGQIEVARNVHSFLEGSDLVRTSKHHGCGDGLRQDRYALRTSSQWLGPVLEDMGLAREQLEVELNSTTDNPLINVAEKHCHHGGNFQASSVASSTEKTRMGLEKIGKMLFAQSAELLDTRLAYNLPPNLAVDEPSLSYTLKGVDINMAAYYSELAFLANPVSNHVQTAEMSNQALNSLALISARYTHTAIDIVSLMSSAYLYSLCQALDLRAMNAAFMDKLKPEVTKCNTGILSSMLSQDVLRKLDHHIWGAMNSSLATTTTMDSHDRFVTVARAAQHLVVEALETAHHHDHASDPNRISTISAVTEWTNAVALTTKNIFLANRTAYLANPDASKHLGKAAKIMYQFVRQEMGIPMHQGLVDHPTYNTEGRLAEDREKVTTGTQIGRIYKALREDGMVGAIMRCLGESEKIAEGPDVGGFQEGMDGDRFFKLSEVYVKGNNIKYLRVPDEIIDLVKDQQQRDQGSTWGGAATGSGAKEVNRDVEGGELRELGREICEKERLGRWGGGGLKSDDARVGVFFDANPREGGGAEERGAVKDREEEGSAGGFRSRTFVDGEEGNSRTVNPMPAFAGVSAIPPRRKGDTYKRKEEAEKAARMVHPTEPFSGTSSIPPRRSWDRFMSEEDIKKETSISQGQDVRVSPHPISTFSRPSTIPPRGSISTATRESDARVSHPPDEEVVENRPVSFIKKKEDATSAPGSGIPRVPASNSLQWSTILGQGSSAPDPSTTHDRNEDALGEDTVPYQASEFVDSYSSELEDAQKHHTSTFSNSSTITFEPVVSSSLDDESAKSFHYRKFESTERHASKDDIPLVHLHDRLRKFTVTMGSYPQICELVTYLIRNRGEEPALIHYDALIRANADADNGSAEVVKHLLWEMKDMGIGANSGLYHGVLQVLAIHPDYLLREQILQEMKIKWFGLSPEGWHNYVVGLIRDRQYEVAMDKLEQMRSDDIVVQPWLYDIFMFQLCDAGELDEVFKLLQYRYTHSKSEIQDSVWYYVLDAFTKAFHYAGTKYIWQKKIQGQAIVPSDGMCTAALNIAARYADPGLATSTVRILSSRLPVLAPYHYEALLAAYAGSNDIKTSFRILAIMSKAHMEPDASNTRPLFLHLSQSEDYPRLAWRDLRGLANNGHVMRIAAANVVLEACCEVGNFDEAVSLYKELHEIIPTGPNIDTFNMLLQAAVYAGRKDLCMFLASEIAALDIKPTELTYDRLILSCLSEADYEDAFRYLEEMIEIGDEKEGKDGWWMRHGTAMSMVRRCAVAGDNRAWDIFNEMQNRRMKVDLLENFIKENWGREKVDGWRGMPQGRK
ncbi:hypothetical protein EG329_013844 [Mollisiaceae sp. DMI_Dod_QoI]|nr:hypothetical protein EG329_013844 [Helotiales sp. DMI_Dod_QoI]